MCAIVYCCTLYNFYFLGFISGNIALTDMNIWLALFWSTWSRPMASTQPHVPAWRMGVIIAIVEPQVELSKIQNANNGPMWGFFNPHTPDCIELWVVQNLEKKIRWLLRIQVRTCCFVPMSYFTRRPRINWKIELSNGHCFGQQQLPANSVEKFIWHKKWSD